MPPLFNQQVRLVLLSQTAANQTNFIRGMLHIGQSDWLHFCKPAHYTCSCASCMAGEVLGIGYVAVLIQTCQVDQRYDKSYNKNGDENGYTHENNGDTDDDGDDDISDGDNDNDDDCDPNDDGIELYRANGDDTDVGDDDNNNATLKLGLLLWWWLSFCYFINPNKNIEILKYRTQMNVIPQGSLITIIIVKTLVVGIRLERERVTKF